MAPDPAGRRGGSGARAADPSGRGQASARPSPPSIEREAVERALERAPVLVERLAADAPFPSIDALVDRARAVLASMSERERIAVLDAHPRIGTDPRTLSAASRREQGGAAGGPGRDKAAVLRELGELNDAYERRFGFRFVAFVAGRPKAEIVPVLRERIRRSRDEELATGIEEFLAIARDRLSRA